MDRMDRNINRICLDGDWTMNEAALQFQKIKQWVTYLTTTEKKPATSELNMNGVNEIDACGCQLLAVIMRYLRECEIKPLCSNISESIGNKIRLLGYDQEFGLTADLSRDCS